jgi:hypothetical protein
VGVQVVATSKSPSACCVDGGGSALCSPRSVGGAPKHDAKQFDPAASLRAGVDPDRALGLIFDPDQLCPDSPLQRKWLVICISSLHMVFQQRQVDDIELTITRVNLSPDSAQKQ